MGKDRKRMRKATPTACVSDDSRATSGTSSTCSLCESHIGAGHELKCKACSRSYHPVCANITDDIFKVLLPILPAVGWVCQDCIETISDKRRTVDNEIQTLNAAVHKLELGYNALQQRIDKVESGTSSSQSVAPASISRVVCDTVKDQLRRKKNVIISGLPESNDGSDADALRSLCEQYLGYKPWFDETKCKRIGSAGSNLRHLLVTLATAQAAEELLYAARKNLKKADPTSLVSTIYFNPDLSPEDAKQAYLRRQERRRRNNSQQPAGGSIPLNPQAQSFPTASG